MKSRINAAPGHSSLPQRRLESDAARRSCSTVAAGAGATPTAFYLGLCRLRGILSLPASHDHAAGGPFFSAATKIRFGRGRSLSLSQLQAGHSSLQQRRLESDAARRSGSTVAAGTGATPAAFYLGLCHLRGILSLPAFRQCCRRAILLCRKEN